MCNFFAFVVRYVTLPDRLTKACWWSSEEVNFGKRAEKINLLSTATIASKKTKKRSSYPSIRGSVECIWIIFSINISFELTKYFLFLMREAFWFVVIISKSFKSWFAFCKDGRKMAFDFLRISGELASSLAKISLIAEIQFEYFSSFCYSSCSGLYPFYHNKYFVITFIP